MPVPVERLASVDAQRLEEPLAVARATVEERERGVGALDDAPVEPQRAAGLGGATHRA